MSKNDYLRIHFAAKIKFTMNILINSTQQTLIEYLLFISAGFRPENKKKAPPARRSQSGQGKIVQGAKVSTTNSKS